MNQEQLNREIAEKLMGHKVTQCFHSDLWQTTDEDGGYTWLLNYFTEGWEQVEDKLDELGCMVMYSIEYKMYEYEISNPDEKSEVVWFVGLEKTREAARYEALKQAWPEILKRL